MADSVPDQDPFDSPFIDDVLRFLGDTSSADLGFDTQQNPPPNTDPSEHHRPPPGIPPQSGKDKGIADPCDPLDDPLIWNMCQNSMFTGETSGPHVEQEHPQPTNTGYGSSIPLEGWPPPVVPFNCSCCHVLREINHARDSHTTKLEIHGRTGIICHAILEISHSAHHQLAVPDREHHMIDFSNQSMESVKQFLVQYCHDRKQAGYVMLQDPLSIFYGALCVGLNWEEENADPMEFIQHPQTDTAMHDMNQAADIDSARLPKSSLAAQRERTGKMTLKDLGKYFPLPIEEAARELNICPTVLKKICRKYGMSRWPHRKIKSMDRKIENLERCLSATNEEENAETRARIEELKQQRAHLCAGSIS